jgi:hypothetical protein
MRPQASQIFRAFTRGEPVTQIAENCGVSYARALSLLRRAVAEVELKNPSAIDAIRFEQWFKLTRVADQAFAAFDRSADDGAREGRVQTIETADANGKLGLTGKSVTTRVRKGAGDIRYLEIAMDALAEIRDLFGIGAEAESKVSARARKGSPLLEALALKGSIQIRTQWAESVEQRHV